MLNIASLFSERCLLVALADTVPPCLTQSSHRGKTSGSHVGGSAALEDTAVCATIVAAVNSTAAGDDLDAVLHRAGSMYSAGAYT